MVARLCREAGVDLGPENELAGPAPDNADGFWENVNFVAINEDILSAIGGAWDSPVEGNWQAEGLRRIAAKAKLLMQRFGAEPWGWKDPRNCLTLPFWRQLLPDLKVLICVRNPLEVALSLYSRNHLSYTHGLRLWYEYNRQVLATVPPQNRLITHYDAYFVDGVAELRRVLDFAGVSASDEIVASALSHSSTDLRHHHFHRRHLLDATSCESVCELYAALCEEANWVEGARAVTSQTGGTGATGHATWPPLNALQVNGWAIERELYTQDRAAFRSKLDERDSVITQQKQQLGDLSKELQRVLANAAQGETSLLQVREQTQDLTAQVQELRTTCSLLLESQASIRQLLQSLRDSAQQRERRMLSALESLHPATPASAESGSDQASADRRNGSHTRLPAMDYRKLARAIREVVAKHVPKGASILVISKGDEELLRFDDHRGMHFPQSDKGEWPGYYPSDSAAAINHLEQLRSAGAEYLLVPSTSFWWLDHYADFARHLGGTCSVVNQDEHCAIYALAGTPHRNMPGKAVAPRFGEPGPECDLICFPVIEWDFRYQRPQQMAAQFAALGHRVFYCGTQFADEGDDQTAGLIQENVYGVQLRGPTHLNLYRDQLEEAAVETLLVELDAVRNEAGLTDVVCLVQLPFWAPLALAARERWGWKVVYDCMDDHSGFSTNDSEMLRHEETLLAESDLVLATSRLLEEKTSQTAKRTLLLPNAADYEHFARLPQSRPLEHLDGPILGYYGAIAEWFDIDLVRTAAMLRPDWQFVLIGHTFGANVSWLEQLQNVHLLGEKPYTELPDYLHQFNVACIPFVLNGLTLATNPVKFYEYLSAGKPVVSVDLPELQPYREHYYCARTGEELVRQVENALRENSAEAVESRRALARQNTWRHRCETLSAELKRLFGRASIIIPSCNNFEYLRLCLDSIWCKTSYPNFEVVVVDNGSDPEVLEYLAELASVEPRLKVIENGQNLGFARANNIAIAASADSEYVVLLNDDTVVTHGWLSRLIEHLQDEGIGLVGPVTNWTGNEAKIDVPYASIEDLDAFARRHGREHRGRQFDISVLAMYCVAMRRSLLDEIGPLDERYRVGMFEDDDFAMRVRRAWRRVVCVEDVFIHHWGRSSFKRMDQETYQRLFEENRRRFEEKWGMEWQPHQHRAKQEPVLQGSGT